MHKSVGLIILIIVSSSTVWAQSREVWISGGKTNFGFPYFHSNRDLGSTDASGSRDAVQMDNGWRIGVRLAFNSAAPFGHEFQYSYNRPNFIDTTGNILGSAGSSRMEIHQAGYNFLYYFKPSEAAIRPLVTLGVHFNDFVLPGSASATQTSDSKFGFNYGLGLKWRITPLLGLRGDLRGYETRKPNWDGLLVNQSGLLHQIEASAGLGIYF
jgi:opacity protein-like surface antigen